MKRNATLSFRLEEEKAAALDRLAETTDRPRSWHLQQAVDNYLEWHRWKIEHIQQGLADLDRGDTLSHEEVMGWVRTWGTAGERKRPR
jgi:predicted transcriptional regulator